MKEPNKITACLLFLLITVALTAAVDAACLTGNCKGYADAAPDDTCCCNRFNLNLSNIYPPEAPMIVGPPTVVDINEQNGNLLVRGQLPLVIRDGTGNSCKTSPCMNHSDWYFAYDDLNTILFSRALTSGFRPEYITGAKSEKLNQTLVGFNLSACELIVISMIDNSYADKPSLDIEIHDFGGNCSNCSEDLVPGTIHGQPGYLIWSPVGFCDPGLNCTALLYDGEKWGDGSLKYCSYYNLIDQITALMQENSTSGRQRLIYYHCVAGKDRTGGVTIGYLLKNYPSMTYCDASDYARYMGKTSGPPDYPSPNDGSLKLARAYCTAIRGTCSSDCTTPPPPGELLPEPDVTGALYVVSYPSGATVTIDGIDYGMTSGVISGIPAGTRNLTLTRESYQSQTLIVTVPAGEMTVLKPITLAKSGGGSPGGAGILYVASSPTNATILINGTDSGRTNGFVRDVPPGVQNVTVTKEGYLATTVSVSVPAGGIKVLAPITLMKDEGSIPGNHPATAIYCQVYPNSPQCAG